MILDFHTHAVRPDPNMPAEYRAFLSTRRGEGLDEFLESYSHPENFLALLDEAGVDYAVVLAETAFITSAVIPNDHIQKFTAASKGRLIPFCTFNPYMVLNPAKGLEVAIQEQGFRGLKLYPTYEYFYPNQPMLYPLYAKAQELGIPVMAHTGSSVFAGSRLKYGDPLFWDDVAVDFPDLTIILNHIGGLMRTGPYGNRDEEVLATWRSGIAAVGACPNVIIKLGGIGMPRYGFDWHTRDQPIGSEELAESMAPFMNHCIEQFGPSRSMFESNFPVDKVAYSYNVMYNAFKRLSQGYSAVERAAMFHDTAARVYRIDV